MAYVTQGVVICNGPGDPFPECEFEGQEVSNFDQISADQDTFIGFSLPVVLDNGELATTKTTLEAVKTNLQNLCSTEAGERVMQPNLGVRLKRYLFEPYSEDLVVQVQNTLSDSINYWMPFLQIINIEVSMKDMDEIVSSGGDSKHTMDIVVHFQLDLDGMVQDSIQITV